MTRAPAIGLVLTVACRPAADTGSTLVLEDPSACIHANLPGTTGAPAVVANTSEARHDEAPDCSRADGPDLRFAWTVDAPGRFRLSTQDTRWDTVLAVYEDCDDTTPVACNDDFQGLQSRIDLDVLQATELVVVVDGFGPDDHGPFELHITPR